MIPIYCAKHDLTIWLHDAITKVVPIVKVNILILVHVVELTNVLLIIVNVKVTPRPDLTIVKILQENWTSANFVNPCEGVTHDRLIQILMGAYFVGGIDKSLPFDY